MIPQQFSSSTLIMVYVTQANQLGQMHNSETDEDTETLIQWQVEAESRVLCPFYPFCLMMRTRMGREKVDRRLDDFAGGWLWFLLSEY